MILILDNDTIDKAATLEQLKAEVVRLAESFAGLTGPEEDIKSVPSYGKHSDGYFMSAEHDSIEPPA